MVSYGNFKICVISPLGYTGMAYYNHSLCQSLSEIGLDVTLVTSQKIITVPPKIAYNIVGLFKNTYGNISRLIKGLSYLSCMFRVYFYIRRGRFKIVHFQLLELPMVDVMIFFILKISKAHIIFTPHDIRSFKPGKSAIFQNLLYKLSDVIIVHNAANKNLLIEEFDLSGKDIEIILHGNYNYFLNPSITKDMARRKIGVPENKKMILLFGSIRPGKGVETAIKAMKFLIQDKDIILLISGKPARGYDISALKAGIKYEELSGKVILRDNFVDDDMVGYYYKSADVVVIPYERAYESGVLRHAFSCGKATIISNVQIFSEFAVDGQNCLIFKAGDPLDLAKKIDYIFEYPDIAEKIASAGKRLSDDKWDWRDIANKTRAVYEKLL